MTQTLINRLHEYRGHTKEFVDTLAFATKYMDRIEEDLEIKEKKITHIETKGEAKIRRQTERTLKLIKRALVLIENEDARAK